MAKRATFTLETLKAAKPGALPETATTTTRDPGVRKGQTLRLSVDAWKQLKMLAVQEEVTSHDLIIEAVNMLFQDRGLAPVAK